MALSSQPRQGALRRRVAWPALGVAVVLVASACGGPAREVTVVLPGPSVPAGPPSAARVVGGRYAGAFQLDGGSLVVAAAPEGRRPAISQAAADLLFRSDEAVAGVHQHALLGFGLASISSSLTAGRFPPVHDTPAWIGLAWGGITSCPAEPASATSTTAAPPPTPDYTAVIVLGSGRTVLAYSSRTSFCWEPPNGPSLRAAPEAVSVPWRQAGLSGDTVTYRYRAPTCDPGAAPMPQLLGNLYTGDATLSVRLDLPYPYTACPTSWSGPASASSFPRLPPGAPPPPGLRPAVPLRHVGHGPTGPVAVLQLEPQVGPGSTPATAPAGARPALSGSGTVRAP